MIGWGVIAPTILSIVTESAKDTTLPSALFGAEWAEGAHGAINDEQRLAVRLKVTNIRDYGGDEVLYDEDMVATIAGLRRVTIQCMTITTERIDGGIWAMAAMERIRTRMGRPRNIEALLALEVSYLGAEQTIKANFKDGGRSLSAAIMDMVFCVAVNDVDPVPMNWIDAVEITSHVSDLDGTELPVPPNYTKIIPEGWTPPTPGTGGTYVYTDASGHVIVGADSHLVYTGSIP